MKTPHRPPISALIVDDEILARRVLRGLLEPLADFAIAGECRDGAEALASIQALEPEVVFLDMQMPGIGGIALVNAIVALGAGRPPALVFVTAHDRFAVDAFQVDAVDYLLKPFSDARFLEAIGRVRRHFARAPRADTRGRTPRSRIVVTVGGRSVIIAVKTIDWVSADGYYSRLHVGGASYLIRASLGALQRRLGADHFIRVHRGALVRLDHVRELRRAAGRCELLLATGARIPVSERRRADVTRRLGDTRLAR